MRLNNKMILADGQYYDLNCRKTQLNNNVLVVGASGAGKTRSIVTPNILQAIGSYLIVDPKGNLHKLYGDYLERRGYQVRKLNFTNPSDPESCAYNPFEYIRSDQDIVKIAHLLIHSDDSGTKRIDPFWDEAAVLLLTAIIGFLHYYRKKEEKTLQTILELIQNCCINEDRADTYNAVDLIFEEIGNEHPNDISYQAYKRFRLAAGKTLKSILITVTAKLAIFDTKDIRKLLSNDSVGLSNIGRRKTALFVVVSDTDRSMDRLASIFFSQAMIELCRVADTLSSNRLPVNVRFILDDFATNVKIADFPRIISSIRSRGISTMLMIQAESQLRQAYGEDGRTVIANCDTYVYLGGNDVETAENVAKRANVPVKNILNMPVGTNWIFRRGESPVQSFNFELEPFLEMKCKEVDKTDPEHNDSYTNPKSEGEIIYEK